MSAKKIIVLPNYSKITDLPVLVQSAPNENWYLSDYRSEIFPNLPKGAGRGIPLAIVSENNRPNFVLGRIVRQQQPVVFLSCQAGQDKTGRIVFLTLITSGVISSLHAAETALRIPADAIAPLIDNPHSPIPKEHIPDLQAAISTLNQRGDNSSQTALQKMWDNFQSKRNFSYFTSVSFKDASAYPPDSEAACFGGDAGQSPFGQKKGVYIAAGATLLLALLLLRQCSHGSQPAPSPKETQQSQNALPPAPSELTESTTNPLEQEQESTLAKTAEEMNDPLTASDKAPLQKKETFHQINMLNS